MTLYRHRRTGEQVRTVTNSYEDNRLGLSDHWQVLPDGTPDEPNAADTPGERQETPPSRAGKPRGSA